MSNNRMWLVCPIVGPNTHDKPERQLLAKATTDWRSVLLTPGDDRDKLDYFLEEHGPHGYEGPEPYPLGTTIHFKLEYEQTD